MTQAATYNPVEIIRKKRDGNVLSDDEIRFFISAYASGKLPDYQAAALLMAVYFSGMSEGELLALTDAMLRSGEVISLSDVPGLKIDYPSNQNRNQNNWPELGKWDLSRSGLGFAVLGGFRPPWGRKTCP